jgi:magnesium transporter
VKSRKAPSGELVKHHLLKRVPTASTNDTVGQILTSFRKSEYDLAESIYVLSEQARLQGIVPVALLLKADAGTPIQKLMVPLPWVAHPEMDQEKMAGLAIRHGLTTVPVIDDAGKFLGVVAPLTLLKILRREHIEDLHRLAGIRRENTKALDAMESPPIRRARDRLPWLLVGLGGSAVATLVVSRYESVLKADMAVAFFVPAIVYLADAIGTQTEAIVVRGISLDHKSLRHLLFGELRTGFLIGLALALIAYPSILVFFSNHQLAAAVSIAILAAGTVATSIGLLLPWSFEKLGLDPAFGSGPVATIIQDIASLLIYFMVAQALAL